MQKEFVWERKLTTSKSAKKTKIAEEAGAKMTKNDVNVVMVA